jgi:L-threonylcarbamoyladenylate synthase
MAVKGDPIAEAAAAARRGALIVFPTDTVYGLATRPDDPAATDRVFRAKRRPADLALPVLVPSAVAARAVAVLDARAERLAAGCWPGALTLVLARTDASAAWALGGDGETVAVRMPHHPLALAVLAAAGPLAVTSANHSGAPPATTCDELTAAFTDEVECYLCQDEPLSGLASTVVDLTHGRAAVLRSGAVDRDVVARLLGPQEPLLDSPLSP